MTNYSTVRIPSYYSLKFIIKLMSFYKKIDKIHQRVMRENPNVHFCNSRLAICSIPFTNQTNYGLEVGSILDFQVTKKRRLPLLAGEM
jgi:hypothetical protein